VRADSDIHKVEDLKGKILASNGLGGAIDMAMRKMLRDHGLEERRDYQIVEVQFPNMIAALDEKKVDLAGLVTPFSLIAKKSGKVRTLFTLKDAMGDTQTTLMAARAPYIATSPSSRHPRSPTGSSPSRIIIRTRMYDPMSRHCSMILMCRRSSACSRSRSTSRNMPISRWWTKLPNARAEPTAAP
jgi:hypothetical protein